MNCPSCNKEVVPDRCFCNWCDSYIPNTECGRRAGLGRRFAAIVLDGVFGGILGMFLSLSLSAQGPTPAFGALQVVLLLLILAYGVYYLWQLSRGTSPGKKLLGITVIVKQTGQPANFWRMLLREIIGKWVSGIVIYLGYLWAIWDKDSQGWHDKIAGTVVVRTTA